MGLAFLDQKITDFRQRAGLVSSL